MESERGEFGAGRMKLIAAGVGLLALFILLKTMIVYISPGHVGIVINRTAGGVNPVALDPGLHLRNPLTTGIMEYPTYMQTLVLTKTSNEGAPYNEEINVNSVEGQPLSLDISMSFKLDPAKVPFLYTTFRTDVVSIEHSYVKQAIRQALQEVVGNEPIAEVIGPKKAEATSRVFALLEKRLQQYGILVEQFTINELRAPPAVIEAINQKNVMQQQALTAENELQKNKFQAQGDSIKAMGRAKAIIAEAEAQARANRLLAESITPTLVQYELAMKWNGQMPQVSGGAMPLIQLPMGGKP